MTFILHNTGKAFSFKNENGDIVDVPKVSQACLNLFHEQVRGGNRDRKLLTTTLICNLENVEIDIPLKLGAVIEKFTDDDFEKFSSLFIKNNQWLVWNEIKRDKKSTGETNFDFLIKVIKYHFKKLTIQSLTDSGQKYRDLFPVGQYSVFMEGVSASGSYETHATGSALIEDQTKIEKARASTEVFIKQLVPDEAKESIKPALELFDEDTPTIGKKLDKLLLDVEKTATEAQS